MKDRKQLNKITLYNDDRLPFGKYKGMTLLEVMEQDPSYVDWLNKNVTNYQFNWEINRDWCYILDDNEFAPDDGLYVMACRGDNHIVYEVYWFSKGDRFYDKYEGKNAHSDGWMDVDCLAYWRIEEYSEQSPAWTSTTNSHIERIVSCLTVCAAEDKTGKIEYLLTIWNIDGLEEGFVIKGYRRLPRFTEGMHCFYWTLWKLKHSKLLEDSKIQRLDMDVFRPPYNCWLN